MHGIRAIPRTCATNALIFVNVQRFRLFTFPNIVPHLALDNLSVGLASDAVQSEGGTVISRHDFVVNEPPMEQKKELKTPPSVQK